MIIMVYAGAVFAVKSKLILAGFPETLFTAVVSVFLADVSRKKL
jgi:hypothetical protein